MRDGSRYYHNAPSEKMLVFGLGICLAIRAKDDANLAAVARAVRVVDVMKLPA